MGIEICEGVPPEYTERRELVMQAMAYGYPEVVSFDPPRRQGKKYFHASLAKCLLTEEEGREYDRDLKLLAQRGIMPTEVTSSNRLLYEHDAEKGVLYIDATQEALDQLCRQYADQLPQGAEIHMPGVFTRGYTFHGVRTIARSESLKKPFEGIVRLLGSPKGWEGLKCKWRNFTQTLNDYSQVRIYLSRP